MGHPDGIRPQILGLVGLIALTGGCAVPTAPTAQAPSSMRAESGSPPMPSIASPSLLPTPSADPILSSLGATTARGTAQVTLELLISTQDLDRSLFGEGVVDFARGAADLRWSGREGDSREVRTEEGFFVEVQEGQWLAVDPERATPTSDAGDVLRGIDNLREPRVQGRESIGGVSVTRITGWLPATGGDSVNLAGLGLTDSELASALGSTQARVQVTVWVDDSGRIIQVLRTLEDAAPIAATSLARLSDFGVAAPIAAPSSIAASAR